MSETSTYGVHVTTDREAAMAASKARARRDAWRATEAILDPARSAIVCAGKAEAKPDALRKAHLRGHITAEQESAGRRYAAAWEARSGLRSRGQLDWAPRGDASEAMQIRIDAGAFLSACDNAMGPDEKAAVITVAVEGLSVGQAFKRQSGRNPNGRQIARLLEVLRSALQRIVEVRNGRA